MHRIAIFGARPAGFYAAEQLLKADCAVDWQAIDAAERGAGEPAGRPRVKFVRVADMHDVSLAACS